METINAVLKNYYSDIRLSILKISTDIAEIRGSKDVGKLTLAEFNEYFNAVLKLREYHKEIIDKKVTLIEVEKAIKRKKLWSWIIIPTVTAILGGLIIYIIVTFL